MALQGILGHTTQADWFETALGQNRLATSFLFVGPDGIGKRTFARKLAKGLLCRQSPANDITVCGHCEDCAQVEAGTHPDLIEISKPAEKSSLPLELLIGDQEHRMRAGLCHDVYLKPFGGRRKIAIIDDADYLNAEGANSLLKTLEEPPTDSLIILISTSLQRQLPTIRSRCQTVLFQPLSADLLSQLLVSQAIVEQEADALSLAGVSGGSMSQAKLMHDPDLHEFRQLLLDKLVTTKIPLAELSKACSGMIDAAGKEARAKRERMKLIIGFASQFYRELALRLSANVSEETHLPADDQLATAVRQAASYWAPGAAGALACWDCCLRAIDHVDRNANQASLLEWWTARLAELSGC